MGKYVFAFALCVIASFNASCYRSSFVFRGIVHNTEQNATTEGRISDNKKAGSSRVDAQKEYQTNLSAENGGAKDENEKGREQDAGGN